MKVIELEQGSQDWLDYRRTKIMASDAAVIMGSSPFASLSDLYDDKIDGKKVFLNSAMKRGMALEPLARRHLEKSYATLINPAVVESEEYSFMAASLDGIDADGCIYEIKCGKKSHELALQGIIPEYYKWQMYHQMEVTGAGEAVYFSYQDDYDYVILKLKSDKKKQQLLIKASKDFYENHILKRVRPESDKEEVDCDDLTFSDDMKRYYIESGLTEIESINFQIKTLEARKEEVKKSIIEKCDSHSIIIGNRKVTRYFVSGTVNYKEIPELKGVDLNKYRGEIREAWRFT